MKKKKPATGTVLNRRARFDYDIERTLIAGVSLSGPETKSLRMGHGILKGSYVQIKDDGAWLINMQVNPLITNAAHLPEQDRTRSRRLLIKLGELDQLREEKTAGRQVIPIKLLTRGKFIKLEIGVGRGKKRYDKRESIKKRDAERTELRNFKIG